MKAKLKQKWDESIYGYMHKLKMSFPTNDELEMFREMMEFCLRNAPKVSQQHQAKRVLEAFEKE